MNNAVTEGDLIFWSCIVVANCADNFVTQALFFSASLIMLGINLYNSRKKRNGNR